MRHISLSDKFFNLSKRLFCRHTKYRIGKYEIRIPTTSTLPINQKTFPLYDRFLPILAKNIKDKGIIIDVGANIGDTLTAMIQHCNNAFLCIEPSAFFFEYLKKNVQNFDLNDIQRVQLIRQLVGTGTFFGELKEIKGSTASVVLSSTDNGLESNILEYKKLDDILQDIDTVVLLKSDVDGFDFDVIESAEKILSAFEPILFFENQIDNDVQYQGFDHLYDFLEQNGYNTIYVFDNFGNIIIEKANYHTLRNINDYVYTMTKYHTTRTFYYTDILAVTDKRLSVVEQAIDDYKRNWVNKVSR
jgi:FkbM family methyltransferase